MLPDRLMADPVRDLNNFLQSHPAGNGGNATRDFKWVLNREGPEHCTTYHVTAVCKQCDTISLPSVHFFLQQSGESTLGLDTALQRALQNVMHLYKP